MARVTALLARGEALPRKEAERAQVLLEGLGVELVAGRGSGPAAPAVTVVGSWKLKEAHSLVRGNRGGVVRGVALLEFCATNAERRDLLTRTETPCVLNVELRGEVVCFSGIVGPDREMMTFKVEVAAPALQRLHSPCVERSARGMSLCAASWPAFCSRPSSDGRGTPRSAGYGWNGQPCSPPSRDARSCERHHIRQVQDCLQARRR